jgi:TonB family protein
MMSAIANSLQKPEGFDVYVRKFRSICMMHGVAIGSRSDLPGFMKKLMDDSHLAMDFWAFVGKLSNREGGEFSDKEVLAVITEGVTGAEFVAEDDEHIRIIDDLRAMLAGVDIHAPEQSRSAPSSKHEAASQQSNSEGRIHAVESPSQESRPAAADAAMEKEVPGTALPPTPPQLDEAFLRLELARLVKQYFDSIDEQKNKLESHPEKTVPVEIVAAAPPHSSLEEPGTRGTEEPVLRPVSNARLVLEPVSPVETPLATRGNDLPTRVPLAEYSQPAGFGRATLSLMLAAALSGAVFAGYQYRVPLLREISTLGHNIRQKAVAVTSKDQSVPPAKALDEKASEEQSQPMQSSVQQTALQGAPTPPTRNARTGDTPTASSASVAAESSGRKAIADQAAVEVEPPPPPDGISSADLAASIPVEPATMEAYLLASRVPVYPENAKIDGIEGSVVMQAIISQDGTVKRVHVLQGDPHLRSAAAAAVYRWRYRPYLLNGQPVDVATTVTVDFSLDR